MASRTWDCGFQFAPMLKYYWGEERKINSNIKRFMKVESHFADARFFKENDAPKGTIPSTITLQAKVA